MPGEDQKAATVSEPKSGPMPGGGQCRWWAGPTFPEYESGKGRRYALLFAVNGGAFALAKFLVGQTTVPEGSEAAQAGLPTASLEAFGIEPIHFGVAMIAFNLAMFADIYAFGWRSAFFSGIGRLVIGTISATLLTAWALASGAAAWFTKWWQIGLSDEQLSVGAAVLAVIVIGFVLERRSFNRVDLWQLERLS